MYSPVLIRQLTVLHHSKCVCTMSTYNNVSMACIKCENVVWGCGVGKCSMGRSAMKSQEKLEFFIAWGDVTPFIKHCNVLMLSRSQARTLCNITEIVQDRNIVTTDHYQVVILWPIE